MTKCCLFVLCCSVSLLFAEEAEHCKETPEKLSSGKTAAIEQFNCFSRTTNATQRWRQRIFTIYCAERLFELFNKVYA